MGLKERFLGVVRYMLFERSGNKQTLDQLADNLVKGGEGIQERISTKSDSERNRDKLAHIIGIERWGQSRLKVALGETFIHDEHDGYCPAVTASWSELRTAFDETRDNTVTIARQLAKEKFTPEKTVRHNDFGDMSLHGWLHYLNFHANQESKGIK